MKPLSVIETAPFIRAAKDLLSDDERAEMIDYIARNPKGGAIIKDTGGARKLRWARAGDGKSGGVRTIYYFHSPDAPLVLLTVYGKGTKANLSAQDKNAISRAIESLKVRFRAGE